MQMDEMVAGMVQWEGRGGHGGWFKFRWAGITCLEGGQSGSLRDGTVPESKSAVIVPYYGKCSPVRILLNCLPLVLQSICLLSVTLSFSVVALGASKPIKMVLLYSV
jgi:hypothetical protein